MRVPALKGIAKCLEAGMECCNFCRILDRVLSCTSYALTSWAFKAMRRDIAAGSRLGSAGASSGGTLGHVMTATSAAA